MQSHSLSEDFLTIELEWFDLSSWTQRSALGIGLALALCTAAERPASLCAQRPDLPAGAIEVVLDASESMGGRLGEAEKMAVAKEFLRQLRDGLAEDGGAPPMGLRVYGGESHRLLHDCEDTEQLVRATDPPSAWTDAIAAVRPLGVSSLTAALVSAASDTATTFVLVTDGAVDCGGDSCGVWKDIVARGIGNRRARLHVVALVPPEPADVERLRCLSRAGSGSFTVLTSPAAIPAAAERLALILANRGLLDVRLTMGDEESFVAPVRVLRPLTQEVVAAFSSRRIQDVPAGMYTVLVETTPAVSFERVLILPGETRVIESSEFGRLLVEVREGAAFLRAPVSVRRSGHRAEVRYATTGEPLVLRAGAYDVSIDLGDSLVTREDVLVESGAISSVVLGGTGTLRVLAAGFENPPPTLVIAYGNGRADSLRLGKATVVGSGSYRLVVHTLPVYVTEVIVEADRQATVIVPDAAILGVDLFGLDGLETGPAIDVREPRTGESYGTLRSGERRLVMPGTYRLELGTVPPRTIEGVAVAPLEREIVVRRGLSRLTLAEPAPSEDGPVRLEVLSTSGRSLAVETGLLPAVTVWPGTYRARIWRAAGLLWQGDISVASDKSARIDWPGRSAIRLEGDAQ